MSDGSKANCPVKSNRSMSGATAPLCHARPDVAQPVRREDKELRRLKKNATEDVKPVALKALFGFNSEVPAKNLTTGDSNKILITSANLLSIYDYEYDSHNIIQAHKNKILSVSVDAQGYFFATSDVGNDARIIIWDAKLSIPVRIILKFSGHGCGFVKLSPCGEYLLTVADRNSKKLVSLWEWKIERDEADVTVEVDLAVYGSLLNVDFCFDNCSYLILTTENQVLFLTYADKIYSEYYTKVVKKLQKAIKQNSVVKDKDKHPKKRICSKKPTVKIKGLEKRDAKIKKILTNLKEEKSKKKFMIYIPEGLNKIKDVGTYLASAYVRGTRMAISSSSKGSIVVWSDIGMKDHYFDEIPQNTHLSNKKNFLMQLYLDPYPVQQIYNIDSYIVTINTKGHIGFYNKKLVPLYKMNDFGTCIPNSISFNLSQRCPKYEMTQDEFKKAREKKIKTLSVDRKNEIDSIVKINQDNTNAFVFDAALNSKRRKVEKWKKAQTVVPCLHDKDVAFDVRDFIITTNNGDILYVNVTHQNIYELLRNYCNISSLDTHPLKDWLCIATSYGKLLILDYNNRNVVKEKCLDLQAVLKDDNIDPKDSELIEKVLNIRCIRYSPDGHWLACGTEYGDIWMLRGCSLQIEMRIRNATFPISKVVFSASGTFLAFYDTVNHLMLYKRGRNDKRSLKFIFRLRAHFEPMTDVTFLTMSCGTYVFSIGEDGYLAQYSTEECNEAGCGGFKNAISVEEFGIPTCLVPAKTSGTNLLVFTSEQKCKVIDVKSMSTIQTVQAPICGPVTIAKFLKSELENDEFLLFAANNEVGLIILPLDGNPFRSASCVTGENKVVSACTGREGNYGFSLSENENIVLWEMSFDALKYYEVLGGEDVKPFILALESDPHSMSVTDMDALYRIAVNDAAVPTKTQLGTVKELLPVLFVPNFFRALGFYSSVNEAKAIIDELLNGEELSNDKGVSFEQCLKLYYNHRRLRFSESRIKSAFDSVCKRVQTEVGIDHPNVTSEDFANFLQNNGEKFTSCQIINYMRALVKPLTKNDEWEIFMRNTALEDIPESLLDSLAIFDFMPESITFNYFKEVILGIDESANICEIKSNPLIQSIFSHDSRERRFTPHPNQSSKKRKEKENRILFKIK